MTGQDKNVTVRLDLLAYFVLIWYNVKYGGSMGRNGTDSAVSAIPAEYIFFSQTFQEEV